MITLVASTGVLAVMLFAVVPAVFDARVMTQVRELAGVLGVIAILIQLGFAWDRDRFLARCCAATDLASSREALARAGVRDVDLGEAAGDTQPAARATMRDWMRANALVERSLPPWLDVPLDLGLLVIGAAVGGQFQTAFEQLDPSAEVTLTWGQTLLILAAVAVVGAMVTTWGGPRHLWEKLEDRAVREPHAFFSGLPTRNKRFARILHQEVERATAMCHGDAVSMRAMAAVSGIKLPAKVGGKLPVSFALAFKFWQVGAGLALGVLFST